MVSFSVEKSFFSTNVVFSSADTDQKLKIQASLDLPTSEGKQWKKVTLETAEGTSETVYLKIKDLSKKVGLTEQSIEEVDDPENFGNLLTEKITKQIHLSERFISIGIPKNKADSLAVGIYQMQKDWVQNFETYRNKYARFQGEDPNVLYLSKKDTGFPLSIEMRKDGSLYVLLKSHVKGHENYLRAKGTVKTVKTAYHINEDRVVAIYQINLRKTSEKLYESEKDVIQDIQTELELLEKYGGMESSELTIHKATSTSLWSNKRIGDRILTFTTEYASGTFQDKKFRNLTPDIKKKLICDVAKSLIRMHSEGYAHRDIKPANLLHTRDGRGILYDFGIACNVHEKDLETAGTILYTPPEVWAGDDHVDLLKGDVWAFGVTLYECLTGLDSPYDEASNMAYKAVRKDDYFPFYKFKYFEEDAINQMEKTLQGHDDLLHLLRNMLELDPEKRPSMDEVLKTLETIEFKKIKSSWSFF